MSFHQLPTCPPPQSLRKTFLAILCSSYGRLVPSPRLFYCPSLYSSQFYSLLPRMLWMWPQTDKAFPELSKVTIDIDYLPLYSLGILLSCKCLKFSFCSYLGQSLLEEAHVGAKALAEELESGFSLRSREGLCEICLACNLCSLKGKTKWVLILWVCDD